MGVKSVGKCSRSGLPSLAPAARLDRAPGDESGGQERECAIFRSFKPSPPNLEFPVTDTSRTITAAGDDAGAAVLILSAHPIQALGVQARPAAPI